MGSDDDWIGYFLLLDFGILLYLNMYVVDFLFFLSFDLFELLFVGYYFFCIFILII